MAMKSKMENMERKLAEHYKKVAQVEALYTILADKIPKDDSSYLFIGRNGGEFTGNVKYLYLHFIKNIPHIKSCFLTHRREVYSELTEAGLPVILFPSEQEKLIASCGTVIVDSISFRTKLYYPLVAQAKQVQLWHGVGNKKIGFQLQGASCLKGRDQTLMEDHSGYDIVVSTSPFYTDEVFRKSMDAKQFVSLGYPRTDIFFQKPDKNTLIGCDTTVYAKVKRAGTKGPVILFTPTFRDNGVNPLTQDILQLEMLVAFLKEKNAHLVVKTHTRTPVKFGSLPDNLIVCDAASDIYPLMPLTDIMITDYSSIFTDYLLLDKPVIFFWSDYDKYMGMDRGFQFPLEPMCPGPKCKTVNELFQGIAEALQGKDDWKAARRAMRDKSFSHTQGGACDRIADYLLRGNTQKQKHDEKNRRPSLKKK